MKHSITQRLEENVFYAIIGAVLTSAGATYLVTKNLTDDVANQKIAEVRMEANRQIDELQRMVNSMNRVIGKESVQFDILDMQVPRSQISQIPPSFHSVLRDRIFVPGILSSEWKGEETNWYEAEQMTSPGLGALPLNNTLGNTIKSVPAYILRVNSQNITVSCPTIWGRPALFHYAPTI